MALIPDVKEGDWHGLNKILKKLSTLRLGSESTPTFGGLEISGNLSVTGTLTLSGLTASRLTSTDASKGLESTDLYGWVTETSNQVLIADDGDGTITFSTPQDIHTGASPTFSALTITNDTATKTLTITDPGHNYVFKSTPEIGANQLSLEGQSSTLPVILNLQRVDNQGDKFVAYLLYGYQNGATGSHTLQLRYDGSNYSLSTNASGNGAAKSLSLGTPGNATQLVLNTDNTISTSSNLTVGGDLTVEGDSLNMSGGATPTVSSGSGISLRVKTAGTTDDNSGDLLFSTGNSTTDDSGDITIDTGTAVAGTVGSIFLKTGGVTAITVDVSQDVALAASLKLIDNEKITLGTTVTDLQIFSDGTNGIIDVATALRIGNEATNYTRFSATGAVTFVGTATVWNDMQFQISDAKVTPASLLPSWETFTTNTSEYAFSVNDEVDTSANEIPHSWKQGTAGNAHIHITTKAVPAQEEKAQFTVTFAYADVNEAWVEAPLTAELTIPISTTALTNFYLDLGDLTLTNYLVGAQIRCRVKRVAKSAGGTEYVGDIFITQVGIHFEEDTVGSSAETTK